MTGDHVRIGVIGTSWFADALHLPALKSHPAADMVAVCGRNGEKAREVAGKYSIPATYTDYRQMIQREKLDAVVIVTPDDLHYEMAMAALDAGLHVLCEKPLALDVKQARAMMEQAAAKHLITMTFFTYRWLPVYRYARELIRDGFIGQPMQCSMRYVSEHGRSPEYAWRFDAARSSGVVGDLGSHMIDLARWLVGDIVKVCGRVNSRVLRTGPNGEQIRSANDEAAFLMEFAGGATATVQLSAVAHVADRGQEQRIVIYGDRGTLEMDLVLASGMAIRGARGDEKEIRNLDIPLEYWGGVQRGPNPFEAVMALFRELPIGDRLFVDAVVRGEQVAPDFADGFRARAVADAVLRSSETGRWESPVR
jgi:predicted dehydrogenase